MRRFGKLPVDAAPMALSPDRKLLAYSVGEAERGNGPLWKVLITDSRQIRSFRMQDAPAFVDHGELVSTVGGRILRRDHDGRIVDRGPEVPGRGFIAAVVP